MNIAIKCEKCGKIFMQDNADDLTLEIDFRDKRIVFICRNASCRHENTLDFGGWQDKQTHSPLPRISTSRW